MEGVFYPVGGGSYLNLFFYNQIYHLLVIVICSQLKETVNGRDDFIKHLVCDFSGLNNHVLQYLLCCKNYEIVNSSFTHLNVKVDYSNLDE